MTIFPELEIDIELYQKKINGISDSAKEKIFEIAKNDSQIYVESYSQKG